MHLMYRFPAILPLILVHLGCGFVPGAALPSSALLSSGVFERAEANPDSLDLRSRATPIVVSNDSISRFERPCGRVTCHESVLAVDIAVRNDAYDKSIGVDWSADGWKTQRRVLGEYRGLRADGLEWWRVVVNAGEVSGDLLYRAFAEMNGIRSEEPFNPHIAGQSALPMRPILRIAGSVGAVDGDDSPWLRAVVSVFPSESQDRVSMWTRSRGAALFYETVCLQENRLEWACRQKIDPGVTPAPDAIEYYIESWSGSVSVRDDNKGRYYEAVLRPRLQVEPLFSLPLSASRSSSGVGGAGGVAGVLGFICRHTSGAASPTLEMGVDGFDTVAPQEILYVSTDRLSTGRHMVWCRGSMLGPAFEGRSEAFFDVMPGLVPIGSLSQVRGSGHGSPPDSLLRETLFLGSWGDVYMRVVSDGRLAIERARVDGDRLVSVELLEPHGAEYVLALAANDEGEAWAVLEGSDRLVSWDGTGRLRSDVGINGRVELGSGHDSGRRSLAVSAELVAVTSPWSREIMFLNRLGRVTGRLSLDESLFSSHNAGRSPLLLWRNDILWWVDEENIFTIATRDGVPVLRGRVQVRSDFRLQISAFVVLPDSSVLATSVTPPGLFEFSAGGIGKAVWLGTGQSTELAGDLRAPSAISLLSDGKILVGDGADGRLLRYSRAGR
jgi:hypothetical protein